MRTVLARGLSRSTALVVGSYAVVGICACNDVAEHRSASDPNAQTTWKKRVTETATSLTTRIISTVVGEQPAHPTPPPLEATRSAANAKSQRPRPAPTDADLAAVSLTRPSARAVFASIPQPETPMPIPSGPLPPAYTNVPLTADTPVFLLPDQHRVPLWVLATGSLVKFLDADGAWYYVSFEDPQWGTRYGFLDGNFVDGSNGTRQQSNRRSQRQDKNAHE